MAESKRSEAGPRSGQIYRFGSCSLDTVLREIRVDGAVADVQPKVFDLLLFLIENRDRMVDKDELLEQIWPGSIVTESSLTQAMRKARAIVGDDGDRQEVIRTVHKRGYRFVAPVELAGAGAAESDDGGTPAVPASLRDRILHPATGRNMGLGAALLIVAAAIAIGGRLLLQGGDDRTPADAARLDAASTSIVPHETTTPANSIAVLPFADLSEDRSNEYFADGMSEELLNVLANIPDLRVAARTSSFSFKKSSADVPTIARQLRVAHVLEGSVRRVDDRVRITVQLINADTGYHLWSHSFNREFDDIFLIQQEIATAVAQSLQITMLNDRPLPVADTNRDAYTLFLQGRFFLRQSTPATIAQSIEYLQRAVSVDPDFARGWHLLGSAYIRQANFGLVPYDEGYASGREAVTRALEIDPEFASAHAQLGWLALYHDFDSASARRHIERALALVPGDYESISYASTVALGLGNIDRAIALREHVVALDPLGRGGFHNLGLAYYYAGRLDEAEAMYRHALSISADYLSGHFFLGLVLLARGDPRAALDEFDLEVDDAWRLDGRALALFDLGRREEADAALGELKDEYGDDMTFQVAEIHAYRGENDAAIAWLERAYERRDGGLWELKSSRLLAGLEGDERLDALLSKMGFGAAPRGQMPRLNAASSSTK